MSNENEMVTKGYVRTENVMLVALLSIAIGFLLGVIFTVYRSGTAVEGIPGAPSQQSPSASMMMQEHEAEIIALEAETVKDPANVQAWISLGNIYFDTQQVKKAIDSYETALKLDAEQADVWTDLGVMYRRDNRPEDALNAFDKAVSLNPGHEISRFNKGIVLLHDLKDNEGAIAAWEALLKINPEAKTPSGQRVDELIQQFSAKKSP